MGGPPVSSKSRGHLALIFNPGRAMRLCSADLSPQAQKRARCPRSLVKNRRREAAAPYHSKLGTGCSKDGLGLQVPATIKKRPLIGVVARGIILPRRRQSKLLARHHSLTIVPLPAPMLPEPVMIMNPPSSDSEVPTRPEILAAAGMN